MRSDIEFKNYLATRRLPLGHLLALLRMSQATLLKLQTKLFGRQILPPYLKARDIRVSSRQSITSPIPATATQRLSTQLPEELNDWAERAHQDFLSFIDGTYLKPQDNEATWTIHQFAWLFVLALDAQKKVSDETIAAYLLQWMERFPAPADDLAWRSYSISERVGHWLNICQLRDLKPLRPRLVEHLIMQGEHLLKNLEEYRDGYTNNHLINNGRALYLLGQTAGLNHFSTIGRTILIEELKRQITAEGILDEGSTHYHFLVTKNYLEVAQLAQRSQDHALLSRLNPVLMQMLRACRFFINANQAEFSPPHIGDVSPDMPPSMFNRSIRFWDFVGAAERSDFAQAWYEQRDASALSSLAAGWQAYPQSGYYHFNCAPYEFWSHARPQGKPRIHAHNDWGGFELHVHGKPLFIDPGRATYDQKAKHVDDRLTLSQNALQLDGFEQALFLKRNIYVSPYLKDGGKVAWGPNQLPSHFSVSFHGYERLKNPVSYSREFELMQEGIKLSDVLTGQGAHEAQVAFHLHPNISCQQTAPHAVLLKLPGALGSMSFILASAGLQELRIIHGETVGQPGGYYSSCYGVRKPTTSLLARYCFTGPTVLQHQLLFAS